jgi:uncharacterized protein YkwD
MNRIALLLFISAATSSAVLSQNKTSAPVAVLVMSGGTGPTWELPMRPRIVGRPVSTTINTSTGSSILSAELRAFAMINRKRVEAGLNPLTWSAKLEGVARIHSTDMARRAYFAHRSPSGKVVADRVDDARLGDWKAIGENIAVNRGYPDPVTRAVEGWVISPQHKSNLLARNWTESAVGVAIAADGSFYFTQVFLRR